MNTDWARNLLQPIIEPEKEKYEDLYEIMKLLLLNDLNIKKVADILYIHKNTLQYRMNIIKSVLHEDPFHKNRFKYTLAIYIILFNEKQIKS